MTKYIIDVHIANKDKPNFTPTFSVTVVLNSLYPPNMRDNKINPPTVENKIRRPNPMVVWLMAQYTCPAKLPTKLVKYK